MTVLAVTGMCRSRGGAISPYQAFSSVPDDSCHSHLTSSKEQREKRESEDN